MDTILFASDSVSVIGGHPDNFIDIFTKKYVISWYKNGTFLITMRYNTDCRGYVPPLTLNISYNLSLLFTLNNDKTIHTSEDIIYKFVDRCFKMKEFI